MFEPSHVSPELELIMTTCSHQGVLTCICGLVMLVVSDQLTANGSKEASNKAKGDLFMVIGATLYGFSEGALP